MEEAEKRERLIEAAVALLEASPGHRMQITNLNKALFYLDLAALRDSGQTLTGNVYVALEHGPILHGYKEALIQELEQRGLVHQDVDGLGKPVVLDGDLRSYRYLDDHWRAVAAKIADFVVSRSAKEISKLSHENAGWSVAWRQGGARGRSPAPIDMFIAMQQLLDADPWLTEPADEEFAAALKDAATGDDEPW